MWQHSPVCIHSLWTVYSWGSVGKKLCFELKSSRSFSLPRPSSSRYEWALGKMYESIRSEYERRMGNVVQDTFFYIVGFATKFFFLTAIKFLGFFRVVLIQQHLWEMQSITSWCPCRPRIRAAFNMKKIIETDRACPHLNVLSVGTGSLSSPVKFWSLIRE